VTVCEAALLPGSGALLAPAWVPWSERVRPGDVGVGDLLPASRDDERLVPAVSLAGDDVLLDWDDAADWADGLDLLALMTWPGAPVAAPGADPDGPGRPEQASTELASWPARPAGHPGDPPETGRARVLSAIGRDLTADRWYAGDNGPGTARARGPGALPELRVPDPARRPAGPGLRGLRERVRARRQPRGVPGPRLRRALRRPPRPARSPAPRWPRASPATTWWTRPASRWPTPSSSPWTRP
jgi:hypothetical protein